MSRFEKYIFCLKLIFQIPDCPSCGGILKPDVIFFGDNVPRPKVDQVFGYVDECDSILVAGSSLFVCYLRQLFIFRYLLLVLVAVHSH